MKNHFSYSDEGDKNLVNTKKANKFTDWMYDEIKPYIKGNILELGSGIGTYSEKIIKDFPGSRIILSEIDSSYVDNLEKNFGRKKNIIIKKIDLEKKSNFADFEFKIDSAFALNVLEHVKNDVKALRNIYDILEPGGTFTMLVPAHKFLFNCIDKDLGHYRRYSRGVIQKKIGKTKFKIEKLFYFNFAAIPGWYVNGNILKKSVVNEGAVELFNKLVPLLRFIERKFLRKKIGVSLIAVLRKK